MRVLCGFSINTCSTSHHSSSSSSSASLCSLCSLCPAVLNNFGAMFYATDLLTRKGEGFGIIWIAATSGTARRGFRSHKIRRSELDSVNLPAACNTICSPPYPLALRFSAQLLLGAVRIHIKRIDNLVSETSTVVNRIAQATISGTALLVQLDERFGNDTDKATVRRGDKLIADLSRITLPQQQQQQQDVFGDMPLTPFRASQTSQDAWLRFADSDGIDFFNDAPSSLASADVFGRFELLGTVSPPPVSLQMPELSLFDDADNNSGQYAGHRVSGLRASSPALSGKWSYSSGGVGDAAAAAAAPSMYPEVGFGTDVDHHGDGWPLFPDDHDIPGLTVTEEMELGRGADPWGPPSEWDQHQLPQLSQMQQPMSSDLSVDAADVDEMLIADATAVESALQESNTPCRGVKRKATHHPRSRRCRHSAVDQDLELAVDVRHAGRDIDSILASTAQLWNHNMLLPSRTSMTSMIGSVYNEMINASNAEVDELAKTASKRPRLGVDAVDINLIHPQAGYSPVLHPYNQQQQQQQSAPYRELPTAADFGSSDGIFDGYDGFDGQDLDDPALAAAGINVWNVIDENGDGISASNPQLSRSAVDRAGIEVGRGLDAQVEHTGSLDSMFNAESTHDIHLSSNDSLSQQLPWKRHSYAARSSMGQSFLHQRLSYASSALVSDASSIIATGDTMLVDTHNRISNVGVLEGVSVLSGTATVAEQQQQQQQQQMQLSRRASSFDRSALLQVPPSPHDLAQDSSWLPPGEWLNNMSPEDAEFYQYIVEEATELDATFDLLIPQDMQSRSVAASAFAHVLRLASNGILSVHQNEPFGPISIHFT
ncbi:hypothetical protein GQ42DRAFT_178436 [Ramicandelaber brevisporus]|nr:hypothetical protein GQ42DRAFT_178436 [Ramicandelaber brevisporus]